MKQVNTFFFLCTFSILFFSQLSAQTNRSAAPWSDKHIGINVSSQRHVPSLPQGTPITFSGTTPIGLESFYQDQFANRGLHNILIDPDHPNTIHAAVQFAQNVTEADTIAGKGFLQQLTVYYLFSSDGGSTWSAPKAIDTAKTQYPEMILFKRGTNWVPAIAAVRSYADTNTPYFCSLYIEQGAPGDGTFKESRTDRKTFSDSLRNLNYRSIALSHDSTKIFMTSGIDNFHEKMAYVQFGTFTLSEDKKSAAWGGWKAGPSAGTFAKDNSKGLAYSWSASVRVSPSGKVGVLWQNRDFGTPDISTYLSESTDDGATWLANPIAVLTPLSTQQPLDSKKQAFVLVAFNFDFWYIGEHAQCAMAGFYYNRDSTAGFYIPQSGSLLFWNDTMSQAVLLISLENDTPLGQSVLDGSWLSQWTNTSGGVDPQGLTTLGYPTVARTSDPNQFFIYFSAWQDGDIEDMTGIGQIGNGMYNSFPYFSIWRVKTFDGGATFTEAERIHGNDPSNSAETKYDYRHIETAPWNPNRLFGVEIHTIFDVDSSAGLIDYAGDPGYDDVTWLFQKTYFSGVDQPSGQRTIQGSNYPNPFVSQTIITFSLSETATATLTVTDLLGRTIARTNYGTLSAGNHDIPFDGHALEAGSFPYVITAGGKRISGMLTIIK